VSDYSDPSNKPGGSRPVPDPTILTTEQLLRAIAAERQYVDSQLEIRDERLRGIDVATTIRMKQVSKFPEQVDSKILHQRELTEVRFGSIAKQFEERDTRSERESRDNNLKVDAAFAAQEKSAARQEESNQKAIAKQDENNQKAIDKLEQLMGSGIKALSDKIDDLKTEQGELRSQINGFGRAKEGGKEVSDSTRTLITTIVAVGLLLSAVIAIVLPLVLSRN